MPSPTVNLSTKPKLTLRNCVNVTCGYNLLECKWFFSCSCHRKHLCNLLLKCKYIKYMFMSYENENRGGKKNIIVLNTGKRYPGLT